MPMRLSFQSLSQGLSLFVIFVKKWIFDGDGWDIPKYEEFFFWLLWKKYDKMSSSQAFLQISTNSNNNNVIDLYFLFFL